MKEYTKIGFIYVAIGLGCFAAVTAIVGLIGLYESSTSIAIATSVMSAIMMQACKVAFIAGKRSTQSSK